MDRTGDCRLNVYRSLTTANASPALTAMSSKHQPTAPESGDCDRTGRRRPARFAAIGRERLIRAVIWSEYWGIALKRGN